MNKHIEYYEGNDQISSGFEFIEKLVDAWFSPDAMVADLEKRHLILGALKSNVNRQRKTVSVLQRGVFERGTPLVFNMSRTLSQVKHHFLLWKQVVTTRHLGQTGKIQGHHGAIMPAVNALLELLAEGRALGARADKGHPFCQDEKTRLPAEMLRLDN